MAYSLTLLYASDLCDLGFLESELLLNPSDLPLSSLFLDLDLLLDLLDLLLDLLDLLPDLCDLLVLSLLLLDLPDLLNLSQLFDPSDGCLDLCDAFLFFDNSFPSGLELRETGVSCSLFSQCW